MEEKEKALEEILNKIEEVAGEPADGKTRISLACSLGLHNWNGGRKCVNCGKTR